MYISKLNTNSNPQSNEKVPPTVILLFILSKTAVNKAANKHLIRLYEAFAEDVSNGNKEHKNEEQ